MIRAFIMTSLLVLSGCTLTPISSLFDECYYDESGNTQDVCVSHKRVIDTQPTGAVVDDIAVYDIAYKPQHMYSTVRNICNSVANSPANACIIWSKAEKTATIWYVYGDYRALHHEHNHIIYGQYH